MCQSVYQSINLCSHQSPLCCPDFDCLTNNSSDKSCVIFVRWFWRAFFEQVVYAIGVLVIPSVSDMPGMRRYFRLFD